MNTQNLERKIRRSINFAAGLFGFMTVVFLVRFFHYSEAAKLSDPAYWGQLGDFFGGLLNPLIAYLAFYWLTQSTLLQKEELSATKDALRDSAEAQLKQERHSHRSAKLSGLSALLSSYNIDLTNFRGNIEFLARQGDKETILTPYGAQISLNEAQMLLVEMDRNLQELLSKRREIIDQISMLLSE